MRINFADTPGQRRFRKDSSSPFHNLSPNGSGSYYDGAVVVFDAAKPETFDSVKNIWLPQVQKLIKSNEAPVILLANKTDGDVPRSSSEVTDDRFTNLNIDSVVKLCLKHVLSSKIWTSQSSLALSLRQHTRLCLQGSPLRKCSKKAS